MSHINKSRTKEIIKKNSKRSSISDDVIEELDNLYLSLLHALVKIDNEEIQPESEKTLKEKHIKRAIQYFDDAYSLSDIMEIKVETNGKDKVTAGKLLVGDESIDINLHLDIDVKNEEVETNPN